MESLESRTKRYELLHLGFCLVLLFILHCETVADQSSPTQEDILSQGPMTCSQVCNYDGWFRRADCQERNLCTVPSSEGCEESIILELQDNHSRNITAESMDGYINVRTLDLSDNDITEIHPWAFSNMNKLTNVLLNRNFLHELKNGTFAGTENTLKRIYLNENGIVKLGKGVFSGLGMLELLYLSNNKIQNLPSSTFHGLNELQFLQLGKNKLKHLDTSIFQNLTKLKSITLNDNKLTSIPNGVFQGLHSLQEVILSDNAIVAIPSPENVGIISLQRLYLDDNNFTDSTSIIPYLHITQERLDISHNPFTCDCSFQFIQEWYYNNSRGDFLGDPVICILNHTRYNIIDPMPFPCVTLHTTLGISTDPMADSLSETTTHTSDTNSTTRYHVNPDDMNSASKCNFSEREKCLYNQESSYKNVYEISGWMASVYCAICLTIFFVVQMSFNIYLFYCIKQKSYRVTEEVSTTEKQNSNSSSINQSKGQVDISW